MREYQLSLYRGDTYAWQVLVWTDAAGTVPADLTGVVALAEIRPAPGGAPVVPLPCTITGNRIDLTLSAAACRTVPSAGQWDLQLTFPANIQIGTSPAQSGAVRLAVNQSVVSRDVGNANDRNLISLNSTNQIVIGGPGTTTQLASSGGVTVANNKQIILTANNSLLFGETAAPAVPAVNQANLWLQDNGAGKSQLMIQFATGAAIAIATQA